MSSRYQTLLVELGERYPGFRVMRKRDSALHRAIHVALIGITFGQMRSYLDSYQTTLGRTVYVTDEWDDQDDDSRYITMRHEAVHIAQFAKFTLPGMAVLYLLLPLPMGLAYFRAYFEKQGYAETMRATAEVYGQDFLAQPAFREYVVSQFTSANYGWMWPFKRSVEAWYQRVVDDIAAGVVTAP
jgi:hypothetical protein